MPKPLLPLDEDAKFPFATAYLGRAALDEESPNSLEQLAEMLSSQDDVLATKCFEEEVVFLSNSPEQGDEIVLSMEQTKQWDESVVEARSEILNSWLCGGDMELGAYSKVVAYALAPLVELLKQRNFSGTRWHLKPGFDASFLFCMPNDANVSVNLTPEGINNQHVVSTGANIKQLAPAAVVTMLRDPGSVSGKRSRAESGVQWANVEEGDVYLIDEVETDSLPEVWRTRHPSAIEALKVRGLLPDDAEADPEPVDPTMVKNKHFAGIGPLAVLSQASFYTQIDFLAERFFEDRSRLLSTAQNCSDLPQLVKDWYASVLPEEVEEYELPEEELSNLCFTLAAWQTLEKQERRDFLNKHMFDFPGPLADKYYGETTTYRVTYLGSRRMS